MANMRAKGGLGFVLSILMKHFLNWDGIGRMDGKD
jgi:hypothetical protein